MALQVVCTFEYRNEGKKKRPKRYSSNCNFLVTNVYNFHNCNTLLKPGEELSLFYQFRKQYSVLHGNYY